MTVTIETTTIDEVEVLLQLLKRLDIKNVKVKSESKKTVPISRGDKTISPENLFGIWEAKPRNIEDIRSNAWQRNWAI